VLTVGLAGFFAANAAVIRAATYRITALESELNAQAASAAFASPVLERNLTRPALLARLPATFVVHGVVDVAVLFAIWSKHF
jgi:hypothetical protein